MGLLRGKKYPKVRVVSANKPPLILARPLLCLYAAMALLCLWAWVQ